MAWDAGKQSRRPKEDFNNFLKDLDGYIEDEDEAKILLYKFLREKYYFYHKPYCRSRSISFSAYGY